jgi:hypothetical protein
MSRESEARIPASYAYRLRCVRETRIRHRSLATNY